ncbi:MAG TPA: Rrf2 family transcriptional regulator [Candidatus Ornithoclostridium excrementipullorum]|nr:Rrf2 family transcriptional regulator [Candidatus Ornithoclostridium excrementipullorum]
MKLSSKGRYGLKAMCEIAAHYGEGSLSLPQIAASTGLSEKYLEQLLTALRKEGLVGAARGASGGYFLTAPPSEITVGSVLRCLENGLEIVDCINGDCCNKNGCCTHVVWEKLYKAINECLDSMTLDELTEV